jgi:TolB protein
MMKLSILYAEDLVAYIRGRFAATNSVLLLVLILCAGCAAWPAPRFATGIAEAPAAAEAQGIALLHTSGHAPSGRLAWAGSGPVWPAPGSVRAFFAAAAGDGSGDVGVDVFAADLRIDGRGLPEGAPQVRRLTDTPAGDETAPIAAGGWLAYATRVGDRYQSVTCTSLAKLDQRKVFTFEQPPEQVRLRWRSDGPSARLEVEARAAGSRATFAVDPDSAAVEPATGNLIYVPARRGEQAWLPNLVSRVRELPFVGPEKIALAENLFFTLTDRVAMGLHRLAGTSPGAPPEAASGSRSEQGYSAGEPPSVADAAPELPEAAAAPAEAAAAPAATDHPQQPGTQGEMLADRAVPEPTVSFPTPGTTASPTALPRPSPSPTMSPEPSPTPGGVRLADGVRRLAASHPDLQRPYAEAEVIELDPRLLQIKMVPGTIEPKPTTGLIGAGVIPREDWASLVAAFNGGFAAMHGKFGMMVDRKVYLPARDGIATLAVYEDGSFRMGTWGADLKQTPDMVSYRQNCPPLIENGTITAEAGKLTLWGLSVSNEVYLYRSGLGVTADGRLLYVAGKPLSAYTLARALKEAGAVYAMQLDVDEFHVAFITYDVKAGTSGAPPSVVGKKLRSDMRGFDGLFLRPFQLDFFYLLRRPAPHAQPVRSAAASAAATPATQAGEARLAPELPGRLAFASNRDGNWEIYAMPAALPPAARRLTDHPADDLYPTWSPDGTQIGFTSRRDGDAEIYTLRLADGALRRETHQPSEEWAPAWSPDGARMVYQTDRHGQSDIYVKPAGGGAETRLTPFTGNHEAPHWSPDGEQIAFDSDLDVEEAIHASINVYLAGVDGGKPRRLYPYAESPSWSPDGRTIALNVTRGGRWQIALIHTDGSGYRQLTQGGFDARYPAWSPDGRWLAFAGNAEGHWEIYAIPAAGGSLIRLTHGLADNTHPAWGQ